MLFYMMFVLPAAAVVSFVCYAPFWIYGRKKYGKKPFIRHLAVFTLIGFFWSFVYLTLLMGGIRFTEYHSLNLVPFVWIVKPYEMGISRMIDQLLMNIAMLVPAGVLLPVVFCGFRRWWKTALVVMGFVFCIEFVQYFVGRSADVDDFIMNTIGGLAGYGIFAGVNKVFRDSLWWKRMLECV